MGDVKTGLLAMQTQLRADITTVGNNSILITTDADQMDDLKRPALAILDRGAVITHFDALSDQSVSIEIVGMVAIRHRRSLELGVVEATKGVKKLMRDVFDSLNLFEDASIDFFQLARSSSGTVIRDNLNTPYEIRKSLFIEMKQAR